MNRSNSRLTRLKARRKVWLSLHLWLGLTLGLFLSIYGITGSLLVFHAEIDEWLNQEILTVKPKSSSFKPLADIFVAGNRSMPEQAKLSFATYPRNEKAAFKLNYALPMTDGIVENWQIAVDPYTAQVLGKRLLARSDNIIPKTLIGFVFKLHYDLLLDEKIAPTVVGLSAALLMISVLSGLIVWWPLTGRWLQALKFKPKASAIRFNYDLHKTSGFYTTLIMLPVLFSGIYMILPEKVVPVLELFSPVTYRYWFKSTPQTSEAQPIDMSKAVYIAMQRYPEGRPHWIYGANQTLSTYMVCLDGVDAPGSLLRRRCIAIDQYSGKILDLDDPSMGSAGEIFTHWQWPLHSGQAFGMSGRILVFLTGLACPVLFITGLIRWLQKKRAGKLKFEPDSRMRR